MRLYVIYYIFNRAQFGTSQISIHGFISILGIYLIERNLVVGGRPG